MANFTAKPQVAFVDATKMAFQKCATFSGRSRRSEFWWAELALIVISIVGSLIPYAGALVSIFVALTNLSMCFRRLRDTGRSGWWIGIPTILGCILVIFVISTVGLKMLSGQGDLGNIANLGYGNIAIMGILYVVTGILQLIVIIFCCLDSDPSTNKYGESPKYILE